MTALAQVLSTPKAKISINPFVGWRFSIAKRDRRLVEGHRFLFYCATETERDALLAALALISGDADLHYAVPRPGPRSLPQTRGAH